jgi:hypothetical protein
MQQFIHGHLPKSFSNMWSTAEDRRTSNYVLRNGNFLDVPFARLKSCINQPLIRLPKAWLNFANEDIKIIADKTKFKINLKKYFLDTLSSTPNCNRLLCPACLRRNTENNA